MLRIFNHRGVCSLVITLSLATVADNVAKLGDHDFAVEVPLACGNGAVEAYKLNLIEPLIADFDRLEAFPPCVESFGYSRESWP